MNNKFTERVRKVLSLARDEAGRLHHDYIGSEHILLGLIREGEGVAAAVLSQIGLDLETIRMKVEELVKPGGSTLTIGDVPYTSVAKKVLEYSIEEAPYHETQLCGYRTPSTGPSSRRQRDGLQGAQLHWE